MKFLLRHWYNISAGIGAVIFLLLFLNWDGFSVLQRFAMANLGLIFFHFFEEFGVPGGFGKFGNTVLSHGSPAIDRYPLNQLSCLIGNWAFALLFYLPPVFFPDSMWLGLMPMIFGFLVEGLGHGILMNVVLKRAGLRYGINAGVFTAVLGFLPLSVAYAIYVQQHGLATSWQWLFGLAYSLFAYLVVFRTLIMKNLEDVNSPYPFDAEEMARFDRLHGTPSQHKTA